MKKELELAFARPRSEDADYEYHAQTGMTLRDYYAGQAMQALISRETKLSSNPMLYAGAAYDFADAMLKARTE